MPRFQQLKVWSPPCISVEGKAEKHGFMSFRNEGGYGKDNRIPHTGEFQKNVRWVPELQRRKVIEFPSSITRSTPEEHATVDGNEQLDHSKAQLGSGALLFLPDPRR